jgi:hypothetical protein
MRQRTERAKTLTNKPTNPPAAKPASQQRPSTWGDGVTATKPIEDRRSHPLVGCCFMVRSPERRTLFEGVIRAIIPSGRADTGDLALVQYFEALLGTPNTLALISLAEMTTPHGTKHEREYVLFEDNQQLREYCEAYQRPTEEHLDRKDARTPS